MYVGTYDLLKICKKLVGTGDRNCDRNLLIQELADFCQVDTATFLCREDSIELINRGMDHINRSVK